MTTVAEVNKRVDDVVKANDEALKSIGEQIKALQEKMEGDAFQEAVTKLQLDVDAVKDTLEKLSVKIGDIPAGGETVGAEFIERVGAIERQLGMR